MKKQLSFLLLYSLCVSAPLFAIEEREGFFKQLNAPATVLTVPTGKKFVLLQLLCQDPWTEWTLKVDDEVIFTQNIFGYAGSYSGGISANFDILFPDRCVTIGEGKSLIFETSQGAYLTIIGYFYNYSCTSLPVADLNKDCKVNFVDLAMMASEWLVDNTV